MSTVFMFPGQGSQFFRMGVPLFEGHRVFREWMTRLDDLAHALSGQRVVEAMHGSPMSAVFDRTLLTHPAIFMVEYSLAQCLRHEGVEPDATLGASLGSFAAAAVSGHLDVEDALAAVVEQA
jgi:acyl transferase domain-containing protein